MTTTTTRSRGRPYIGDIVEVRLPPDVIALYEAEAARQDMKRAELMRAVLLTHSASMAKPTPKPRRGAVKSRAKRGTVAS